MSRLDQGCRAKQIYPYKTAKLLTQLVVALPVKLSLLELSKQLLSDAF